MVICSNECRLSFGGGYFYGIMHGLCNKPSPVCHCGSHIAVEWMLFLFAAMTLTVLDHLIVKNDVPMCHSSAGILLLSIFFLGCCSSISTHFQVPNGGHMLIHTWSFFSIHLPAELHPGCRRRLRDRQDDWNDNLIASLNKGKVQGGAVAGRATQATLFLGRNPKKHSY